MHRVYTSFRAGLVQVAVQARILNKSILGTFSAQLRQGGLLQVDHGCIGYVTQAPDTVARRRAPSKASVCYFESRLGCIRRQLRSPVAAAFCTGPHLQLAGRDRTRYGLTHKPATAGKP